jgi:thiamine pyrophosphokinase
MLKMSESINKAWLITHFAPLNLALNYSSITADDTIVAVDGGLKRCLELNLLPDVLIGDFDSIEPSYLIQLPDSCKTIAFSSEKNETDTQLALQYCLEHNAQEVLICNDLSGRFDHSFALVQNLLLAHKHNLKASVVSSNQILTVFDKDTELSYPVGSLLSLISLTEQSTFFTSQGLKYSLSELTLYNWQSRGISNVFEQSKVTISLTEGTVLSIVTLV